MVAAAAVIPNWLAQGEPDPNYMGAIGTSNSGKIYLISEGRIGTVGQAVNLTLTGNTTPWIYSAIEFDSSGNPSIATGMFPTYTVYKNGQFFAKIPQSAVAAFASYNQSYELTGSNVP
jgi:hypothetical protein